MQLVRKEVNPQLLSLVDHGLPQSVWHCRTVIKKRNTCLVFEYAIACVRLFTSTTIYRIQSCSSFKMAAGLAMWVLYIRCQIT